MVQLTDKTAPPSELDDEVAFAGAERADPLAGLIAEQQRLQTEKKYIVRDVPNAKNANETFDEYAERKGLIRKAVPWRADVNPLTPGQQAFEAQFEAQQPKEGQQSLRAFSAGIGDLFPNLPQYMVDQALYKISEKLGDPIPGLRTEFPPDPNFDLMTQLKEDKRELLAPFYDGVDSFEKYASVTHYLELEEERKQIIREAPADYSLGGIVGIAALPEAWVALGVKGGAKQIIKQSLKAGMYSGLRNYGLEVQKQTNPDYSRAASATTQEIAMTMALGGLFRVIGRGGSAIKTRYNKTLNAEDASAAHATGEKVAKEPGLAAEDGVLKGKDIPEPSPESVGAASNFSGRKRTLGEELQGNAFDKTYAGLDFITPIGRILSSGDVNAKQLMLDVFEVVPRLVKNTERMAYQATETAVETLIRTKYRGDIGRMHQSIYNNYWKMIGREGAGGARKLMGTLGFRPSSRMPTALEFRQMVSEARRSGVKSDIPEVNHALKEVDMIFNKYMDEMIELGIPWDNLTRQIKRLSQRGGKNAAEEIADLQKQIEDIKKGIRANATTFLPRLWRKDKIEAKFDEFVEKLMQDGQISRREAQKIAHRLKDYKPYIEATDKSQTGAASSFHARELNWIKDSDYAEFLENDILSIMTQYSRTMAPDLELYRKFGSIDLEMDNVFTGEKGPLALVKANYEAKLKALQDAGESTAQLVKERDSVIEDLLAMRDLMRGTYMVPADPNSGVSRAIRVAKNFSAMTLLTGAMAAAPDIARVVTANGLRKSMGSLFDALMNNDVWKKGLAQNREVGESFEFWLNSRAAQIADLGDSFGMHNRFESAMSGLASLNFVVNGMSLWNDFAKTATGIVVGTKILQDVEAVMLGTATKSQRERLAASGIGQPEIESIYKMRTHWDSTDANVIANSAKWDNLIAKEAFDNALAKEIGTVVVTPGLGEKPLFMSNEYISLLTQFKSFAMSSHTRVLVPMIQNPTRQTATQIALMTAIGSAVGWVRNEQLGGPEMSIDELIYEGVVRSGWTGLIMDADNYLHELSGGTFSMANALGQGRYTNEKSQLQMVLGPSISQGMNAINVAGDILNGDMPNTSKATGLLPYSRIAHFQMMFDAIASGAE